MENAAGSALPPPQPAGKNLVTEITLLIITLAHILDFVIMMPLGPKMMAELSISAATFGQVVSSYTFAAAFSSLFSTTWVDRIDRKFAMLWLLIGFTAGNLLCATAANVTMLILGRVSAGLFGGVMGALVYAVIGQVVAPERRGRATGTIGVAFPIVSIVGIPFGLRLADLYGWRVAFYLVLAMSTVSILLTLFVLPRVKPERNDDDAFSFIRPILKVWKHPNHRTGTLLIVLTVIGGFTIVPYIAPFLVGNSYIAESQLYLIYLVGGLASILSAKLIGYWSDRFGKMNVLRILLIMACGSIMFFTTLPSKDLAVVLLASTLLMIFLPGRFICAMAWITLVANPYQRGVYMSFIATVQQVTVGLAAIAGGYLVGEQPDGRLGTYYLTGIVAVAANMMVFALSGRLKRLEEAAAPRV
jgi:predicted MFS family arabinose efflux permease